MAPAPNRKHEFISGEIEYALRKYLEENPVGVIYDAPFDVQLSDTTEVQPDICYFSKKRLARLTEHGAVGAPDLVVEILSPKTAQLDLGVKREIYARTGVLELWIIDPVADEVRIYQLRDDAQLPATTLGAIGVLSTSLLPGLSIVS